MIDFLVDALAFAHKLLDKADELVEWLSGDEDKLWETTETKAQKPSA